VTASAAFDHLVVAAATLEEGEAYLEQRLGVRAQRGGKHVAMGTHNSLIGLGAKRYIELIAIDPEASAPDRPRWFALDSAALQSRLREAPRLIHWVARTDDIGAARQALAIDTGAVQAMTRDAFEWRITVPADGALPAAGVLPTLIQWSDACHPADALPDYGLRLLALAAAHPQPGVIRSALAALSLGETVKVTYGTQARLAAMVQTRRGPVTF
jgi:hypothetical protein